MFTTATTPAAHPMTAAEAPAFCDCEGCRIAIIADAPVAPTHRGWPRIAVAERYYLDRREYRRADMGLPAAPTHRR